MHYLLYFLFLPYWASVTPKMGGLGSYSIGMTTPESLDKAVFKEEDQVYAKGTLTLSCSHIRLFKAARLDVDGLQVINLSLAFYDNKLFGISCDYSAALQNAFVGKHGQGSRLSKISLLQCLNRENKPLLIKGQSWTDGDIQAVAVQMEGYNSDCQQEEGDWLMMVSHRVMALSSDCDLGSRQYWYERLVDAQHP